METSQTVYGNKRKNHQGKNRTSSRYDRKRLIIRAQTRVKLYEGYIGVKSDGMEYYISIRRIYAIYFHLDAKVSLHDLFTLSYRVRVYLIDGRGNILGKVQNYEKK